MLMQTAGQPQVVFHTCTTQTVEVVAVRQGLLGVPCPTGSSRGFLCIARSALPHGKLTRLFVHSIICCGGPAGADAHAAL